MGLLKRIFGICETKLPEDNDCWKYSDNKIEIDLEKAKELTSAGKAIRLEGDNLPERILVMNGNDGQYHAFLNICTHGKRRIDPVTGESLIRCCSVGKSTFDYNGKLISGAAKEDLRVFGVKTEDGKIIIDLD